MIEDTGTVGDAMIEILQAYGVEHIFSSPGSEWAPLWDALAKAKSLGKAPAYINTQREELAVGLAIGYHHRTRKLPAVLLHSGVGPLAGAMALRAATRERIPMVVLAGDTAGYGEMPGPDPGAHWLCGLADVGGPAALVRPYVKRSGTVTCREVLLGMLQDACRLALTPPSGPVFLSVPQEFMFGEAPSCRPCTPPPAPLLANSSTLQEVAQHLANAEHPVIVAEYAGRDPRNVDLLVELVESWAIPVVEARQPIFLNFPRDHELHQGFDADQLLSEADLVLLTAAQMPWHPPSKRPTNAKVILLDDDPSHELLPYWGFGIDSVVSGDLGSSLRELNALGASAKAESDVRKRSHAERRSALKRRHEAQREEWRAAALAVSDRMDARWVTWAIGEALPRDALVIDETVARHRELALRYIVRSGPGTYHSPWTGGLGIGLGIALGSKLAEPGRLVTAVFGDGGFNYNPVLAGLSFAQQFGAPVLVILMDNQGYESMKLSHLRCYPDGWSARTNTFYGTEIASAPDYAGLARLFGGYGEQVDSPVELQAALRRAIQRVEAGQLALLDVIVDPLLPRP